MKIKEIREGLDIINKNIFNYSLCSELSLGELESDSKTLEDIKEGFLKLNFTNFNSVQELEQMRFKVKESSLNIEIYIRELKGQDTLNQLQELKKLFETIIE